MFFKHLPRLNTSDTYHSYWNAFLFHNLIAEDYFCVFLSFFSPPDPITHLAVCNNYLVMAMSSNILLRIDLEHPDTPDGKGIFAPNDS